MYAPK
jgi:hypothetical protein